MTAPNPYAGQPPGWRVDWAQYALIQQQLATLQSIDASLKQIIVLLTPPIKVTLH